MLWADARSLAALCACSGATYAFANSESLWRALALRTGATVGSWHGGSWRTRQDLAPAGTRVTGVYSDVLFHRWRVRCFQLPEAAQDRNTVDRHNGRQNDPDRLSVEAFRAQYEGGDGTPVVLSGACSHWPAMTRWRPRQLAETAARRNKQEQDMGQFLAGGHSWSLEAYLAYAADNADDVPLYLFDRACLARADASLGGDYSVPDYFGDDLFRHLPADSRPVDRWLLVGGPRSGSAFHTDPNGISAWSATVSGRKKWVFFPPHVVPPGVVRSADGVDLVAPLSVAEWFEDFYAEAAAHPCVLECTTGPGDVVFVPRMWRHMVINVSTGVADDVCVSVSHNFCSPAGLGTVLRTLRDMPQCVAGIVDDSSDEAGGTTAEARRRRAGRRFRDQIITTLREHRPAVLEAALAADIVKKSAWQTVTEGNDTGSGFAFGFDV